MKRSVWGAFTAVCVLSATSWIVPRGVELPPLELQGFRYGAVGVVAFLLVRGKVGSWARCWRLAVAGMGFFGVPMVIDEWARVGVPEVGRSALFAIAPIVVIMVVAAGDEDRGVRRFLIPALVGLGGLLLLLPVEFSGSFRGRLMLVVVCLAVILVGLSSVWLYLLLRGVTWTGAVATVCLANAILLLVYSWVQGGFVLMDGGIGSLVSASSLVDVTEVLLLLWLLREMAPVQFSARYLVIPSITILESYVLIRPELTVRIACGTALLAAGAGMLLFLKIGEEDTMLSLH